MAQILEVINFGVPGIDKKSSIKNYLIVNLDRTNFRISSIDFTAY